MTTVRAAVIQAHANMPKDDAVDKHVELIAKAAADGAEVTCLQEIFHGPYFCAEQDPKWYATAEPEDGPLVTRMREVAKTHNMVLVVPWFEEAQTGVYYNSAVVIERDGTIVGKYRKTHIPHVGPCFWEKFYFKPGNLGYPVFDTSVGKVGLIICYDRHFPEIGRALGLKGAEIVFNPSATVESLSKYLWELEQPAMPSRTATGSRRSTGWAPRSRCRARSSTGPRTSATPVARSWRRLPTRRTRCSCTTSTWT